MIGTACWVAWGVLDGDGGKEGHGVAMVDGLQTPGGPGCAGIQGIFRQRTRKFRFCDSMWRQNRGSSGTRIGHTLFVASGSQGKVVRCVGKQAEGERVCRNHTGCKRSPPVDRYFLTTSIPNP